MKKGIVLAAGEGKRMKSNTPKVLHRVLGISMLKNVIRELRKTDIDKIIVIVGHGKEEVIKEIEDLGEDVIYKEQPIGEDAPYGTGYAAIQALDEIEDEDEVLVVCGDTPLLRGETLKDFLDYQKQEESEGTVMTAIVEDNFGYGRIVRDEEGNVKKIVEEKDASPSEKEIKEINSGVYGFTGRALIENLKDLDTDNSQGELYLTDVIRLLNEQDKKVSGFVIEDNKEILGVNSRLQLVECDKILRNRINKKWLEEGVTIIDPSSTLISPNSTIGRDTYIGPNVRILGDTNIGNGCIIEGDTKIVDSDIGDNVEIKSTYITESKVEENVTIGPFAQLRPKSIIRKGAHIGNFVELKKTDFGKDSKAGHLAYLGDSKVGEDVNIGCGVITVNYDGEKKEKTIIGDHAFIGSNSNLIAPIEIGKNAFVAAGSTITKNVDEEDLAIERGNQVIKAGWVRRKNKVK